MPELPEVEVTRMGIKPYAEGQKITEIKIRQHQLRWQIPNEINKAKGLVINAVKRRAKYLLLETDAGDILIHLGMSGTLRVLPESTPETKHDHVDLCLESGVVIRYNDPRRFGAWLWQDAKTSHALFAKLGPEPLSEDFSGEYLFRQSRNKRMPIKQFIMNNAQVVGVGNIYANEALFLAKIHPQRAAQSLTEQESQALVVIIKEVLAKAIAKGGTTLKDFAQVDGKLGYFAQELNVYGRQGEPCVVCGTVLESIKLGQRNTVFCPQCQPL